MRALAILLILFTTPLTAGTRYIVEFRGGGDALTALRDDAPRLRVQRRFSRVLNGAVVDVADAAELQRIQRLPYVERVSVDAMVEAYGGAASFSSPALGGLKPAAPHAAGNGIVVAVIDTGIDRHHPALAGKVIGGWDFTNDDNDPMDDHRHGTHVAGIIAASGDQMTGVAPQVSLLAYKVLNHEGRGPTSDIVAGIERAVADGADVINLSLGTGGHPDDPLSRAVENAVAAGVVVCVAAGNSGSFHTIGSPGVAHSAITVGATNDEGALADFTSRGPANRSGAIKPDLVAPGVSILSTVPNGEYAPASGTSMATPYVAGLAALLLEQHPDWTPARVKSALVSTALPIANEEPMSQGTGLVNRDRAFASDIVIAPTHINFGLDGTLAPTWSSTRKLSIRNAGAAPRTIRLTAEDLQITPSEVTLNAGETRELDVAIEVVHEALGKPQTGSHSFGGRIALEWDGGSAHVPWAFVRAGRSVVTYPGARPEVMWNFGERYGSIAYEAEAMEALVEPGTYDLVAIAATDGDVRVFVAEQQQIAGDVMHAFAPELAQHEIRFDAVDERGLPFAKPSYRARLLLADGPGLVLPAIKGRTLHATSFSERYALFAIESAYERDTVYVVQHAPLRGLSANAALRNTPADFAEQEVRVRFNSIRAREIVLMPRDWPRHQSNFGLAPETFRAMSHGDTWTTRVLMTPEHAGEDFVGGLQLSVDREPPTLITPLLRRDANGFFTSRAFARPIVPTGIAPGEVLELGGGVVHPSTRVTAQDNSFGGEFDLRGSRGDARREVPPSFRVFDGDGVQIGAGQVPFGGFGAMLPGRGAYRAELVAGEATMTLRFDTTFGNVSLPTLTSLAILDGAGHHTTRLPRNGNGALVFSTSDASPEVAFRRRGMNTWVQLTPVRVAEDAAYGVVHRVELADALRIGGEIDIAIEMTNDEGSRATWIAPAFSAYEGLPKHRAARH